MRERSATSVCPCCCRSGARGAAAWGRGGCFSRRWFWRRFGQRGGVEWKHCSAPAVNVNASLHRCRYYFWSPHSGQVSGKGLLHMKHYFPGTLEWELRLSPGQNLKPASPESHSQGTFCSLQLVHFRCSIQLENILSSRCWQLWESRRKGRKCKA